MKSENKVLAKQDAKKESVYPEEKNPFQGEENGLATKNPDTKHKKAKKKRKKLKVVKGKKEKSILNLENEQKVIEAVPSVQNQQNHTSPSLSSVPSYLRTTNSSNNDNSSNNKTDSSRLRKKPSEGDIKTLKDNRASNYGKNNPFADVIQEEDPQPTKNLTKIPAREQKYNKRNRKPRSGSVVVSSRERSKSKRMRVIRRFKKKKKDKRNHREDEGISYNPKSKQEKEMPIGQLRQQVEDVAGVMKNRVGEELLKRQSNLSSLQHSTENLERFSKIFAETSHQVNVQQQAKAKCCGLFARNQFCRYLCTCNLPFCMKRKKKRKNLNKNPSKFSRAYADQEEDDDAYELAATRLLSSDHSSSPIKRSANLPKMIDKAESKQSVGSAVRNSRIFQAIGETKFRRRKSGRLRATSSMGDLADLIADLQPKNMDHTVRRSIQQNINQYEDDETKRRAAELLLLDYS